MGAEHVNSIPVVCLETGVVYAAISEAKRSIPNGQRTSISSCCRNRGMTASGLHWMFKEDYDKLSQKEIDEIIFTRNGSKQVVCLETRKIYKQMIDAQADSGVCRDDIRKCCNHKMNAAKGTHWVWYIEYINLTQTEINNILEKTDPTKTACRCIETGEHFASMSKAALKFNTTYKKIQRVCRGKLSDINGYHFEFVN